MNVETPRRGVYKPNSLYRKMYCCAASTCVDSSMYDVYHECMSSREIIKRLKEEGLMLDHEPVPAPRAIEDHQNNPDYAKGLWALVSVDLSRLSGRSRRINITLPERLVNHMHRYASAHGETRSGLIARRR